jgi:hypothetical protein
MPRKVTFVPGGGYPSKNIPTFVPGTNVTHLYWVEISPGKNVGDICTRQSYHPVQTSFLPPHPLFSTSASRSHLSSGHLFSLSPLRPLRLSFFRSLASLLYIHLLTHLLFSLILGGAGRAARHRRGRRGRPATDRQTRHRLHGVSVARRSSGGARRRPWHQGCRSPAGSASVGRRAAAG